MTFASAPLICRSIPPRTADEAPLLSHGNHVRYPGLDLAGTCSGNSRDVVAMAMEMTADLAVVAGHDIAIHPRRPELEILLDLRQQSAHDLAADFRCCHRHRCRQSDTVVVLPAMSNWKPESTPPCCS
jgi:hypothetical protein